MSALFKPLAPETGVSIELWKKDVFVDVEQGITTIHSKASSGVTWPPKMWSMETHPYPAITLAPN